MLFVRTTILILASTAMLSGCRIEGSLGPRVALRLEQAERLWEREGLRDYDYEYLRVCFCLYEGSLRVRVRNGAVVAATRLMDGTPLPDARLSEIPTVEGLFEIARTALAEADEVTVEYHPTLGYPTDISIDWHAKAIDDEVSHLAKQLVPAP